MITPGKLRALFSVLLFFILLSQVGCEEGLPPVLFTDEITDLDRTTATSGGSITSEGGSAVTARGVCWNTTGDPTIADDNTMDGEGGGAFESSITGLTAGTTYYLRAYATNSGGTSYGEQVTFTTVPIPDLPTLRLDGIGQALTDTTALAYGALLTTGGDQTTIGVCWSTSPNPTTDDTKVSQSASTGTFQFGLVNLTPGTTYFVRAFATNFSGTVYSDQLSFKTLGPVVIQTTLTFPPKSYTFTLRGDVTNTGGSTINPVASGFVYGTMHNPVVDAPGTYNLNDRSNDISIVLTTVFLGEVTPGSSFFNVPIYFRPYVRNEVGYYYGSEVSLTINNRLPGSGVTDIDGNTYQSLITAYTEFTTTNLKTTKLSDGTPIELVTDNAQWASKTTPAYTFYNNDPSNNTQFGILYNWYAVNSGKLCPAGWHVPSFDEYGYMAYFNVCSYPVNCQAYRVGGTSGFEGRLGGKRNEDGTFSSMSTVGYWWAGDTGTGTQGRMFYQEAPIQSSSYFTLAQKPEGLSVRCVKD